MKLIMAWSGFWTAFGLLDLAADTKGKSLCTATRTLFHNETDTGHRVMMGTYCVSAVILGKHLGKRG